LIYRFDSRDSRKQEIATELMREGLRLRKAVISYQVIQEFYNTMLRRFPNALTVEDSEQYLSKVCGDFQPSIRQRNYSNKRCNSITGTS
jgi:predicted nucleic acid-binding protein